MISSLFFAISRLLLQRSGEMFTRAQTAVPIASCIVMSIIMLSIFNPMAAFAQTAASCPGIDVKVQNIQNNIGTISCALFDSPKGFPREVLEESTNVIISRVRKREAQCHFVDIPPGTYALVVLHDEDMDGEMDTSWLGLPEEGYGFSGEAEIGFEAPSFSDASFYYDGEPMSMTIKLNY